MSEKNGSNGKPVDVEAERKAAQQRAEAQRTKAAQEAFSKRFEKGDLAGKVQRLYKSADDQAATKGFDILVQASQAINLDWPELAIWTPQRGSIDQSASADTLEVRLRALQDQVHPLSSPTKREEISRLLRLAVHASSYDVAAEARSLCGTVPKKTEKAADRKRDASIETDDAARERLESEVAKHRDAGNNEGVDFVQGFVDAIDDPTGLARIGKQLSAMQSANTRWRASLYLNLFANEITSRLKPFPKIKVSDTWDKVCAAAAKAHTEYMNGNNVIDQTRLANVVSEAVSKKLTEITGNYVEFKPIVSADVKKARALDAIYRACESAAKINAIDPEKYAEMTIALAGYIGPDVEKIKADKLAKEKEDREAELAAKNPTPAKVVPAKKATNSELLAQLAKLQAELAAKNATPGAAPVETSVEVAKVPNDGKKKGLTTAKAATPKPAEPSIEDEISDMEGDAA